jgi:dienelactone hydrolase
MSKWSCLLVVFVSAALLGACGAAQTGPDVVATATVPVPTPTPVPIADLRPLFDYPAAPLDVQEASIEVQGDVAVHDLSYASPMGGRVTAYLVVPPGEGPFAGILFLHPGGGSRASFLDEALALAQAGAVSLLIDGPEARPEPWGGEFNYTPENDRLLFIQSVVDMRRGLDLLATREDVDPERVGFVGSSYGAHMGGVLAGVETRIQAYVLMSGFSRYSERIPGHIANVLPAEDLAAYLEAIVPLDAANYVGHAAPAALLFQCGRQDEIIDEVTLAHYYEAASRPKEILWYDAGHALDDQAWRDLTRWLGERLGLDGSAVE